MVNPSTEQQFTPGPWVWWTSNSWKRLKRDTHGITQNVMEPYVCSDRHPDCSINAADMALIAAAPDLFFALQDLLSAEKRDDGDPLLEQARTAAAAALKKAVTRE